MKQIARYCSNSSRTDQSRR